jgi:predicted metal-dependent HD superfamily phosphohydrolase
MSLVLEETWNEATLDLPKEVTEEWWTKILEKYNEEGRSYHNIHHLEEKFEQFKTVKHILKNANAVILAIFFH